MPRTSTTRGIMLGVAVDHAYDLLMLYAQVGGTMTWQQLTDIFHWDPRGIGGMLEGVRDRCNARGEPNLASLVTLWNGEPPSAWTSQSEYDHEQVKCHAFWEIIV